MIPISLTWDSREKSVFVKWGGIFCIGWEKGNPVGRIFKIRIPCLSGAWRSPGVHLPRRRWVGLKEVLSFIRAWELKRAEGTFSLEDPMVNGVLYGWLSAFNPDRENRKINLSINFVGENWCSGEAVVSPKVLFHHFLRWLLLYFRKRWKLPKGGR